MEDTIEIKDISGHKIKINNTSKNLQFIFDYLAL